MFSAYSYFAFSYLVSDIDECRNPTLNVCVHVENCINAQGNYTCSCRQGYSGDGRKDGKGCVKDDQLLVMKVTVGKCVSYGRFKFCVLKIQACSFYFIAQKQSVGSRKYCKILSS